jgi:outer membrane protein OmpA-like peptidoglycan-associated protein
MRCSFLLMLVSLGAITAQTPMKAPYPNVVPNPGFERFNSAPIGWYLKGQHFTEVMKYWSSPTAASPDAYGPKVRVPANWADKGFGSQKAHGGTSMVGITLYGCDDGKPHCREYLQVQLMEPLVIGQNYYVEFWASHLPRSYSINNLGVHFSTTRIDLKSDELLRLAPKIKAENIVSATKHKWVKVSGRFVADSEAEYLIVGNFFRDEETQFQKNIAESLPFAYYYIDDVVVRKEDPIIEVPVKPDDLVNLKLETGKVIQLKNIYFDFDKWELHPRSFVELYKLLKILRDNAGMTIEIIGHTDNIGNATYNQYLSRKRAQSVAAFLNGNGIAAKRTQFKGMGFDQPLATNSTDEGRQMNRRVEFRILKM